MPEEDLGSRPTLSLKQKADRFINKTRYIWIAPGAEGRVAVQDKKKADKKGWTAEDEGLIAAQDAWDTRKKNLAAKAKETKMRGPLTEQEYNAKSTNPSSRDYCDSLTNENEAFDCMAGIGAYQHRRIKKSK